MVLYSEIKYSPKPKNKAHELYESDKLSHISVLPILLLLFSCWIVSDSLWHPPPHMDYSTPGSSVPGISQARILEWVATSFSIAFIFKTHFP